VLDNIFYDYTVVETEIIFIKRIGRNLESLLNTSRWKKSCWYWT